MDVPTAADGNDVLCPDDVGAVVNLMRPPDAGLGSNMKNDIAAVGGRYHRFPVGQVASDHLHA